MSQPNRTSGPTRIPRALAVLTERGRLVALLGSVLAVAGSWWGYPALAGTGTVLLLLVVAEVVAVLTAPLPRVRRTITPLVVTRQGPCQGHLRLEGPGDGLLVRTEAAELVDGRLVPVELPPTTGEERTIDYPVPTTRRGLLDVGPLRLRRSSLAGLAAYAVEAGDVVQVRVLPRRIPVTAMAVGHRRTVVGGDDSTELGGIDLLGLHEYAMGDDLRRLHWATSARTGRLMVREDTDPAEPHVCVVLDDRARSHPAAGRDDDHDGFEEAVELAAALCRAAVREGSPLRFRLASGREEIVVPGSATRTPRREARDVEWLLAELGTTGADRVAEPSYRALDVLVVVTGPGADPVDLLRRLPHASDTTLCVVDPAPGVTTAHLEGALVLRAGRSQELARLWDLAEAR